MKQKAQDGIWVGFIRTGLPFSSSPLDPSPHLLLSTARPVLPSATTLKLKTQLEELYGFLSTIKGLIGEGADPHGDEFGPTSSAVAEVVQLLEDYRSHGVFRTEHQRGTGYGLNPYWPAVSKEKHEKMMGEWLLVPRGLVSDASSPEATTTALLNLADELLLSHLSYPHAAVFSSLSRLQFEPSSLSCSRIVDGSLPFTDQ